MTFFDWSIVLFVAMLGAWGFRQGAVLGVSSLLGFLGGVWLGTQLAGKLLEGGNASAYAPLFALVAALMFGIVIAELTMALGYKVRVIFTSHIARRVDGVLGAVLLASFAIGIVWVGAAAVAQSRKGGLRKNVRQSAVVRELNALLPPTGPLLNAIARIDPVPQVSGPSANVPAPDPAIASDPDIQRAAASTVRVLGTACGYGVEGSGWFAGPGLVVTNAHVVSGQTDTIVQLRGDGVQVPATAIWFDPRNDLALLYTPSATAPPLQLESGPVKGLNTAIVGYPLNGPLTIGAARLGATRAAVTDDIYGNGPITRSMTSFRGEVRHGNSGGPLVDQNGFVRGTIFASESNSGNKRGYSVPVSVIRAALNQANPSVPVSTGSCS